MAAKSKYFDIEVFKKDSPERNYWLGFLAADGCVSGYYVTIRLKDLDHVEKFRAFCSSKHKVSEVDVKDASYYQLAIGSRELVELLATFNISPAKSYSVSPPEHLAYNTDYWRGVIDGDGCLRITKQGFPAIELVGSKDMCAGFLSFIKTIGNTKTKVLPRAKVHRVTTGGLWVKRVVEVLYGNAEVALDRKAEIAKSILSVEDKKGAYL